MLDFSDDGERLDHFDLAAAEALAKSSLRAALQVQRGSVVSHINITYTYMYTCVGNNMVMMNHEFPQLAGMPPDVQARSQLQELILRKHSTEQMQAQQICFRETLWEIRGFYPQRPRFSEGFLWIFTVKVGQT